MNLFSRKRKTPDAVAAATTDRASAGRLLAWAVTEDGHLVALLDRMLVLRDGEPVEEVGWHDVLHGGFGEDGEVKWTRMSTGKQGRVRLTEPQSFPEVFRERVESTFLLQQVVTPYPGRHVTISARRNLMDSNQCVLWTAHPARGTTMDADVLAFAETELARLRAEYAF